MLFIRIRLPIALAALYLAAGVPMGAQAQTPPATPAPSASPTASPAPAPDITWQINILGYTFKTTNPNATGALDTANGSDLSARTDISNALVTVTKNTGPIRFGATVGEYAFPVAGAALNPTFRSGSNTDLFSVVPLAYVQYVPNANWTFTAGKLGTLLGQESIFTYQNVNIQRGLGWNEEPVLSRGIRATYTKGKFTGNLEFNDGFYSGSRRAFEGSVGWSASANTSVTFAWIVPDIATPPNRTSSIANKAEYDLMLTQQYGKLQLTPYILWLNSPANGPLGYAVAERAYAASLIANYQFNPAWSLAARFETTANASNILDTSANADLVGFGAGSSARSFTLTPQYKANHWLVRAEVSRVELTNGLGGSSFGPTGTLGSQTRAGLEAGIQF